MGHSLVEENEREREERREVKRRVGKSGLSLGEKM